MNNVAQRWLVYMGSLGALVIIVANPNSFLHVATAINKVVGGTMGTMLSVPPSMRKK